MKRNGVCLLLAVSAVAFAGTAFAEPIELKPFPGFACCALVSGAGGASGASCLAPDVSAVVESARKIPVAADVDVVVVGGTSEGVAAALSARAAGVSVFLAGGLPYLGEDMAGTLELECDPSETATDLEKSLRAASTDEAVYSYRYPEGFRFLGGWQYYNDPDVKLSISSFPRNPGDSILLTNALDVACTLEAETAIASVEVLVIENDDPNQPAVSAVDHRGAIKGDGKGPLTGRVTLTCLDGARQGETVDLVRKAERRPVEGDAIRDGEPNAVRTHGSSVQSRRKVVVSYAATVNAPLRTVRIRVESAAGAVCQLLSRIRFQRAATARAAEDPSPLKVKQTFDAVLMRAGVKFLTGALVTDLIETSDGRPAGVVIANRSGRQAIRARAVVDATLWRSLAHLGGERPGPGGRTAFSRIVIARSTPQHAGVTVEQRPRQFIVRNARLLGQTARCAAITGNVYRCSFTLPVRDGSYASLAAAELAARELTWTPSTLDAADLLYPQPLRPLGDRIRAGLARGRAAAESALRRTPFAKDDFSDVRVAVRSSTLPATGNVREALGGLRPYDRSLKRAFVTEAARELPVLGTYDVVVVGGGTAGVPAGVSAARAGAKTLVVEYLNALGGVSTEGMIFGYYYGNRRGFTREFDSASAAVDAEVTYYKAAETYRRLCRDAGVEVWFGTFGEGALVADGRMKGVVVVTPFGRGIVRAKTVIDATGDADVASAAGAWTCFIDGSEFALQSAGVAPHRLGRGAVNSDFGYVNDPCAWDLWLFGVRARAGAPDSWDVGQVMNSRERRRIVPDYRLEGWDIVSGRRFPDTINQARSTQDSHGYLKDDYCLVSESDGCRIRIANIPLRSYLPRGIEGLAVVGLGKGVARDAVPITRMRADLTNEGFALGLCAAEAVRNAAGDFRKIDVKKIQRALVAKGNLDEGVTGWTADPEISDDELVAAVASVGDGMRGAAAIMRCPDRARPLLRTAYAKAVRPEDRQALAVLLGLLGDGAGGALLADIVTGKVPCLRLRPASTYGGETLDRIAIPLALGRGKSPSARAALLGLLARTDPVNAAFVDVRAVTLALEALADPAVAKPLAEKLATRGLCGWAVTDPKSLSPIGGYGVGDEMVRCLREIAFARALFACGDCEGRGRAVLEAYARDPRGTLAEHANAVLRTRMPFDRRA